jgi:hypothetical protein
MHHITESAVLISKIGQHPHPQGFLKFASQPDAQRRVMEEGAIATYLADEKEAGQHPCAAS